MNEFQVQQLARVMNYKSINFSLRYLDLSLSDKKLQRYYYKMILNNIQDRLPGWQDSKLSIAGREVLANAILSTKPVYFMLIFLLSKWIIKDIDKIR
jgi:hypothetical protein